MAFDLVGANPKHYDGEWIRYNVWTWHRLWESITTRFPEEKNAIKLWYSNAGEFVPEDVCHRLADRIESLGVAVIAHDMANSKLPMHADDTPPFTLMLIIEAELPAFVAFLKSCGGFFLK